MVMRLRSITEYEEQLRNPTDCLNQKKPAGITTSDGGWVSLNKGAFRLKSGPNLACILKSDLGF